jgi:cation diffusion facilitator CzcD-associated flavoprotein CzcO
MDLDTTIIGAGPYGLSIAAHLRAKGNSYRIYGRPMESWRKFMPDGMILKSEPFASNLWDPDRRFTFERYCRTHRIPYEPVGEPLTLDLFLKYAEWFRQNTHEEPEDLTITRIRRKPGGGFALEFANAEPLDSRRVVLATGHIAYRVMPAELAGIAPPAVAHSARMEPVSHYAGRDVTVIGGGQSALETAAILNEIGARVRLLVRENNLEWWTEPRRNRSLIKRLKYPDAAVARGWQSLAIAELPRVFRLFKPEKRHPFVAATYGPGGSWWLRDRVEGRIDVRLGTRVTEASQTDGRLRLKLVSPTRTEELLTDHVIAATGFKVDIDRLDYLDPTLKGEIRREARGIPALSPTLESSVPGLYFVGITSAPVFGPIMRFMYGAKHAAPLVAKGLAMS